MAKKSGVWNLQQVRDKQLQSLWSYYIAPLEAHLYTWGRNEYHMGALGLNDTDDRSSPVQIPGVWSSVANSTEGSTATKTDGTLWSWGYGGFGMLGLNQGPTVKYSSPVQIGTDTDWKQAFRTERTSHALKTDGTFWSWGNNLYGGALGLNDDIRRSSPVQMGTDTDWDGMSLYGGQDGVNVIKSDGTMWAWGTGTSGVLAQNNVTPASSPVQIPGTWSHHGGGSVNYYGIKSDGTLWGWGEGSSYAFGNESTTSYSSPIQIGSDTDWGGTSESGRSIAGFRYGALAIKTNGTLYGWGTPGTGDRAGALGQNDTAVYQTPVQIPGTTWSSITAGVPGCINALKTDGTLWSWGGFVYGGTAINVGGPSGQRSSPTQVPGTWSQLGAVSSASQNQAGLKPTS
tara:strand:+ start:7 stop:1206 length:1200 start_codon:yes stop_codon:yes gene_type:complete